MEGLFFLVTFLIFIGLLARFIVRAVGAPGSANGINFRGLWLPGIYGVIWLVLFVGFQISGGMGYFQQPVKSDEVGVQFERNQPVRVVGPGVYTEWGLQNLFQFKSMSTINVASKPFTVEDDEVLTKDKQRIGVVVNGAVLRPGVAQSDKLLKDWATYRVFYTDDNVLIGTQKKDDKGNVTGAPGLIDQQGKQAVKVCVGDNNFDDVVIGSARDKLKDCIDSELSRNVAGYGLTVQNVVVPNIVLASDVQKSLDAITNARLAVNVANQQAAQNSAQADAELQKQTGAIRVQQATEQEKAKQQAILAGLQADQARAQQAQIEATKNNDLLAAQKDKEIATAQALAAAEKAKANKADDIATAQIYQNNPAFAHYQEVKAQADAYKATDKTVIVPSGTNPILVQGNSSTPVQVAAR